ncbi:AAA family ATPase [Herbidospora sp. NEAU-GS84]|uniref:AAA family ATPase n=1 Tax=Herbidospora solisilvae TaxID=2696284 RepID=A0A7C9J638_9ACTN|nr:BREX system ATP-binding domain-containing protein [Herbidospora solisilvae]NAS25707.1 AAA family ATPase [Herbidospora solisilvae]
MDVRVLGPIEVVVAGRPAVLTAPKERMLLALLVLAVGGPVERDVLVDRIWGESAAPEAMASLYTYVSHLRRVLEPGRPPRTPSSVLVLGPAGYELRVEPGHVDEHRFLALVAAAEQAMAGGDHEEAERAAAAALTLWRGEPYADLRDLEHVAAARARLLEARDRARELRVDAAIAQGRHAEVIGELDALTRDHPMRERLWALRALALYRSGRQADALDTVRAARRVLAEELGLDPGDELRQVEQDILRQSPSLRPPVVPRASAAPPALVGRERELAAIDGLLTAVQEGTPGLAMIIGEAGIGKTRLAEEAVARAQERGFVVAVGRCAAVEGSPAFWPWIGVLDRLLDSAPGLPGEVRAHLPGTETAAAADPDGARFRTYQAAGRVLSAAVERGPVAVVLDDLQWADVSSLRLLRHLAETFRAGPLAIVATARDHGHRPGTGALADVFEAFARVGALWLEPSRLTTADVAALMPSQPFPGTAPELAERTDGNPFFVTELVRHLAAGGDPQKVPGGVRNVVLAGIERLPGPVVELLRVAAIAGRRFDAPVVARAAGLTLDAALDGLDAAGTIVEGTEPPGRFRFSHALVQEALVHSMAPARRARVHAAVAEVLEESAGESAAAAHHWLLGASAGYAGRAWRSARRAAAQAFRLRAYDVAAGLLDRALETAQGDPELRPADRVELLSELADARYGAGDTAGQREALDQVRRLAKQAGDRAGWIAAATRYGGRVMCPWKVYGRYDADLVADLREIAGLPGLDDAVRGKVLGCLAVELYYQQGGDPAERDALSARGVECARRTGDPVALGWALNFRYIALLNRDLVGHRVKTAEEIVRLGERAGDDELRAVGLIYLVAARLEAGQAEQGLALVDEAGLFVSRMDAPYVEVIYDWLRLSVVVMRGDPAEAERIHRAALERHRVTSLWGAEENAFSGWLPLALVQARHGTLAPATLAGLREYEGPLEAFVRDVHALLLLLGGHEEEARDLLGPWHRQPPVPDDFVWLVRLAVRGELWSRLCDRQACADLYALILPYADRIAMSGLSSLLWPMSRTLGLLARVTGDQAAAARHEEHALRISTTMGADAWWC